MDLRDTVDLVASGYEWLCPQCEEVQEEPIVPETDDLTCQSCGANYIKGNINHAHMDDTEVPI